MPVRWVLLLAFAVVPTGLFAAEPAASEGEISFFKQVLPIFRQKNCTGCHQPAKQGGEYVMTEFAALLKGGESGSAAVAPGHPEKSYLVELITPADGKAEMPKDGKPLRSVLPSKPMHRRLLLPNLGRNWGIGSFCP